MRGVMETRQKAAWLLGGWLFLMGAATQANPLPAPVILDAPASAHWHAASRSWFVSNLGGGLSFDTDGYGWISRFDENGRLLASRWVEFLHAPTGLTSIGDTLYAVDRGVLALIDIPTARVRSRIDLPGAGIPNDVAAAPNGDLYVSDTALNRIYRVSGNRSEVWLETDALQGPSGLWVDGEELIVATWGPMTDIVTFAAEHPGTLLKVNLKTKELRPLGEGRPIANFAGIVKVDDVYYATDWSGGQLLKLDPQGKATAVMRGFFQLADLGYSPAMRTLGLPVMRDNRFILLHLDALRR
ncbi:MAG: hypothetical protein PHQ14_07165 [Chromatiales bacterium]|jgi:hypothetical protein|nr:hypothetical protein [Chromatiales bacterium]MDX9765763.1 hypothetical protein [Ectothiorhodospiraceae bacterium]